MKKFYPTWEAKVLHEEVLIKGVWYYGDTIPFEAQLIKQKWNYTSFDLELLDDILVSPYFDYISYSISDEGVLYIWKFQKQTEISYSPNFSTFFQAKEHIATYGSKFTVTWEKE